MDQDREGYHNFKVLDHDDPDEDWAEYSTRDGSEILTNRKEWLTSIPAKPVVEEPVEPGEEA